MHFAFSFFVFFFFFFVFSIYSFILVSWTIADLVMVVVLMGGLLKRQKWETFFFFTFGRGDFIYRYDDWDFYLLNYGTIENHGVSSLAFPSSSSSSFLKLRKYLLLRYCFETYEKTGSQWKIYILCHCAVYLTNFT